MLFTFVYHKMDCMYAFAKIYVHGTQNGLYVCIRKIKVIARLTNSMYKINNPDIFA